MADISVMSCIPQSLESNISSKKKYTRTRSKSYKKRKIARRKKKTFYKRKNLHRYLIQKTKKVEMNASKQMLELPHTVVQQGATRWQSDEIAFWKAKAVSLQYENQMLYRHIEDMYTNMIMQNTNPSSGSNYLQEQSANYYEHEEYSEANEGTEENNTDEESDEEFNKESRKFRMERDKKREELKNDKEADDEYSKPPTEQVSKKREEERKTLYGSAWQKIMGMETVVQLNYDLAVDKQKINFWPILPIKL